MQTLPVNKIIPDENQPRRYFDAEKMRMLRESIKRDGIITPLVVEKVGDNYLLVDGERRYRAAVELKLKEVPVVIEEPKKLLDRMIRRFTIQEQREEWTPIEKAIELINIAHEIGLSVLEVCKLLNISDANRSRYAAFASMADKEAWVKSEVPLSFVEHSRVAINTARRITEGVLKKEYTKNDEKKLERRIIHGIKEGSIARRTDLTRLADSFTKDPKSLERFLQNEKLSAMALFLETGAEASNALRNVIFNCSYIGTHGKRLLEAGIPELTLYQREQIKNAKHIIEKILEKVD